MPVASSSPSWHLSRPLHCGDAYAPSLLGQHGSRPGAGEEQGSRHEAGESRFYVGAPVSAFSARLVFGSRVRSHNTTSVLNAQR